MIGKVHFRTRCNTSRWDPTLTPRKTVSRRKLNSCDRNAPKAQMGNLSPRNHWFASNCFTLDFPPNLHENSKRVTVASELVSRNDFCHIRVLLLAYLSVRKVVFGFYRSKPSGWASARTSILRLGPGLLRTRESRLAGQNGGSGQLRKLDPGWPAKMGEAASCANWILSSRVLSSPGPRRRMDVLAEAQPEGLLL